MSLYCRTCGEPIPAEDVNIDLAIAKCRACDAVFCFGHRIGREPADRKRAEVPMPKGIAVEQWGNDLTITRRWFSPVFVFLLFFCIAWDGFLVFWYSMAFSGGPWIMIVFPIAHVAVGVGLTYYTVAGFLNRSVIKVSGGVLTVRHAPLPWPGTHTLNASDLAQAYCTEHFTQGRNSSGSTSYRVNAMLADGRKIKLLDGLTESDQALFIEQQLESHLGIPDSPVRGEMP